MHKYIELFPENLTFEEINLGGRNVKYSKNKSLSFKFCSG